VIAEADARLRDLERRALMSGDPDTKIEYLGALKRAGQEPDLKIIAGARTMGPFLARLWQTKQFDLVFTASYPFGNPGSHEATQGVRFVAEALRIVHAGGVRGVRFSTFYALVRRWLERHNQDDKFGRTFGGSTPLETFFRYGEADEEINYDVDSESVSRFDTLWFPTGDQAQSLGFHYGELVSIGDHINGGAIIRTNDWGTRDLQLFRLPIQRDVAWAHQEEEHQEWVGAQDDEDDEDDEDD